MFAKTQSWFISRLLTAILPGSLLLSACSPVITEATPPTATPATIATLEATTTTVPTATMVPATEGSRLLSLDTGSMATAFQTETIAAVSAGNDAPYWEVLPEYTLVTLQGYPIDHHLLKPQIFIYPLKDLGEINEGAGKIITSLQTLLQTPRELLTMPFLPLFNASQVMHADLQYLDFKNGQGLRYLTEFAQGITPINSYELIYTYQGLTDDGKYYVAAVLPVNHPNLPADGKLTGNEPPEFTSDFPTYRANVAESLASQAEYTFTPDLCQLDAMMSSLEIK